MSKWKVSAFGQLTGNEYIYEFKFYISALFKARYIKKHELVDFNNIKIYRIL